MTITNENAINYYEALVGLGNQDSSVKLPAKISYAIVRNTKLLEPIALDALNVRESILQENGNIKADDNGNVSYLIDDDKQDFVKSELISLLSVENDINLLMVSIDSFNDSELSLQAMNALYFMVDGGEG